MAKIRLDQKPTLAQLKGTDYFPVLDYEDLTSSNIPKLKKSSLESLKTFIGGSTPSAQPDRVIIIDSTLTEDIEGKAYSTFSAAMAYMEANLPEYDDEHMKPTFCVMLPAGEFNESVTLSPHWYIRGNATTLMQPLKSDFYLSDDFTFPNPAIEGIETGMGFYNNEPDRNCLFPMRNCRIKRVDCFGDYASQITLSVYNCVIEEYQEDHSEPVLPASLYALNCCIFNIDCGADAIGLMNCSFAKANIWNFHQGFISNCGGEFLNLEFTRTIDDNDKIYIYSSHLGVEALQGGYEYTPNVELHNSIMNLYDREYYGVQDIRISVDGHSSLILGKNDYDHSAYIKEVDAAANSLIGNESYAVAIYQPQRYMYSTDGGSTMSDDPTGATHVGLLRDPNAVYSISAEVSDYIWIPLSGATM